MKSELYNKGNAVQFIYSDITTKVVDNKPGRKKRLTRSFIYGYFMSYIYGYALSLSNRLIIETCETPDSVQWLYNCLLRHLCLDSDSGKLDILTPGET